MPGILYAQVGALTPLFIAATVIGFIPLALKYQEICWRNPEGRGVVSVATKAFTPRWGVFGGFLILISYFFTIAISTVSGLYYLATIVPAFEEAQRLGLTTGLERPKPLIGMKRQSAFSGGL